MTTQTLSIGTKVWVLNHRDDIVERTVASTWPDGIRTQERGFEKFDFSRVFDSEADAARGALAIAEREVAEAQAHLAAVQGKYKEVIDLAGKA